MSRTACPDVTGGVQHVVARSIEGRAVFRDNRDRREFVRRPDEVIVAAQAQRLGVDVQPSGSAASGILFEGFRAAARENA
jgi:hypothetical protein